jgi:signal transduction histidine kinase
MEKYLSLEESVISGKIVEGMGEKKDGSEFYAETSTAILKQGGETFLVAILRDITERKQAEVEKTKLQTLLSQAQKMEAIAHLTGGIAHDFNNILTAIIGYASLMQMKMKEDEPLRPNVNHILGSAERAANLTQSLLAFSRRQIINPQPVKINEIIYRTEKLLIRLLGEDIELKTILADEDPVIIADTGQVEQILMNLATNARDAMPSGGHLIIKTEMAEIDKQYIKTYGFGKIGHYVLLSVSDTGVGIDEKMLDKIFDPFFTTKEVGKGTGLGLSMAYGIVKQHNGYINCFSNLV